MKSHRVDGDPIGSEAPRGKSRFQRKSGRDPGLTPTEQHQKAQLMRQFMRNPEGPGGASEAYVNSPVWCDCGRHMRANGTPFCEKCLTEYCGHCGGLEHCAQSCVIEYPGEAHKGDTMQSWRERAWADSMGAFARDNWESGT